LLTFANLGKIGSDGDTVHKLCSVQITH